MIKPEKVLYTAHATSTGGREGTSKSDDGVLDVKLTTPKGLGGNGAVGTNPEQLFAAGYSACFIGAMKFVADAAEDRPARRHVDQRRRRHRPDPAGLRHPGRAPRLDPGHGQGAGAEARRRRAPGLPVLERDPRQHRGHARRRLSCGGALAAPAQRDRAQQGQDQLDARLDRRQRRRPRRVTSPSPARRSTLPSRQRVLRRTATPRAMRLEQRLLEALVQRAVAGRGDDDAGDAAPRRSRSTARPSAPATLVTISTHGHAAGVARQGGRGRSAGASAGQARKGRSAPSSTCASGPARPSENASRRVRMHLAHRARRVDLAGDDDDDAVRAGVRRDGDRVGEIARPVGLARRSPAASPRSGRRALSARATRSRKYAVSSSVSVPWVMTTPHTSRPRQVARDRLGEPAPDREVHVLAVDLRHLLALDDELGASAGSARPATARPAAPPSV